MQIELDEATVARLRKQAESIAMSKLIEQIMDQFDAKQIAGEVKNSAIRTAAQKLADQVKTDSNEVINRALRSAEEKARLQITSQLSRGIIVKFAE